MNKSYFKMNPVNPRLSVRKKTLTGVTLKLKLKLNIQRKKKDKDFQFFSRNKIFIYKLKKLNKA